jgi:hypothetical protein
MRHISFVVIALLISILPANAQVPFSAHSYPSADTLRSVVLESTSNASVSAYFVQQRLRESDDWLVLRQVERPDSELSKPVRYVLGGTLATVSIASFVGGVWLGRATITLFRSDALLSNGFGALSAMLSAGAFGFSVTSGIWSLRLFRGKAMLMPPSYGRNSAF